MAYVFQTKDSSGKPHPRWRFQYTDWQGKRRTGTGYASKADTDKLAVKIQSEQDEIRKGYRPPPKSSLKHAQREIADVVAEYIDWGESQGGRGGRPWGKEHARKRRFHLDWWVKKLKLEILADIDSVLPRVETALRELQNKNKAGKTIQSYAESISAFCGWCLDRSYLDKDPLQHLSSFDKTPKTVRRAMTLEEIGKLLNSVKGERRLLYETAICSGLRAGELRALKVENLDVKRLGFHLEASWTKNRKPGFQPLPISLVERLSASAKHKDPSTPLLKISSRPSQPLDRDLKRAGIPKYAPGGKLDFHSLRTAYVTLVIESGASVKEAQALARHAAPDMTMNVYGRVRHDRLSQIAEEVGNAIFPDPNTISAQSVAVGAETCLQGSAYDQPGGHSSPPPSTTYHEKEKTGGRTHRFFLSSPYRFNCPMIRRDYGQGVRGTPMWGSTWPPPPPPSG